jgi:hypothetical protein
LAYGEVALAAKFVVVGLLIVADEIGIFGRKLEVLD